jgi:TRAP-type C4-dicarboxylate transport system permease small subunit
MATEQSEQSTRLERVLAGMVLTSVVLSLICFFAVILAGPFNYSLTGQFGAFVIALPLIGLPIGFALMITLVVVNIVRRRRSATGTH